MIDFLFLDKGVCYFCKKEPIEKYHLCSSCLKKLDYMAKSFKLQDNLCYSIYFYNNFMKRLIGDYKFNRNTSLYKVFGQMLYEFLLDKNLIDFDYILASPSSKETIRFRGFDHIRLIVDEANKTIKIPYLEDFEKVKNTKSQHKLNREERMENLLGAFRIDNNINGKSILLVDDLITTGNTCLEIIKELKKNGAAQVVCLSLATERGGD